MLDKQKLMDFFKNQTIVGGRNNEKINEIEIENSTYNPFDSGFVCEISFNNYLRLVINKENNKFIIRVGYSNWIGGIPWKDALMYYIIDEVTTDNIINGFIYAKDKIKYSLISTHGEGSFDKEFCVGSIDELREYALSNGYEVIPDEYLSPFYCRNRSQEMKYKNERSLTICVLQNQNLIYYK